LGLRVRQRRKKSSIRKPASPIPVTDRKSVVLVYFDGPPDIADSTTSVDVNFAINVNYDVNSPLQCVDGMRRQLMIQGGEGSVQSPSETALECSHRSDTGAISRSAHVHNPFTDTCPNVHGSKQAGIVGGLKSSTTKLVRRKFSEARHPAICCADSSFDDCLQFVTQQEAILSYYYTEEEDGEEKHIKVVEIFPLNHSAKHERGSTD